MELLATSFSPCCGTLEAHADTALLSAWFHEGTKPSVESTEGDVYVCNIKALAFVTGRYCSTPSLMLISPNPLLILLTCTYLLKDSDICLTEYQIYYSCTLSPIYQVNNFLRVRWQVSPALQHGEREGCRLAIVCQSVEWRIHNVRITGVLASKCRFLGPTSAVELRCAFPTNWPRDSYICQSHWCGPGARSQMLARHFLRCYKEFISANRMFSTCQ